MYQYVPVGNIHSDCNIVSWYKTKSRKNDTNQSIPVGNIYSDSSIVDEYELSLRNEIDSRKNGNNAIDFDEIKAAAIIMKNKLLQERVMEGVEK
jgi:hypothetical protein